MYHISAMSSSIRYSTSAVVVVLHIMIITKASFCCSAHRLNCLYFVEKL